MYFSLLHGHWKAWCTGRLAALFMAVLLPLLPASPALASAAAPQRIVSLNLCTDQLVLMLADRHRIASVSAWAHRPESSYMAEQARGLPLNRGLVEEIIPLQPDLVIAGPYTDPARLAMLRRLGYRVELVAVPTRLEGVEDYIRRVAQLVHAVPKGEALIENMHQRMAEIRAQVADRPLRRAVVYGPNGISAGAGTLLNELLQMARLRNMAAERGLGGYRYLSLEHLIAMQPEVLVLEATVANDGDSLAHRYLHHPALTQILNDTVVVELPPRLSDCIGPMVVDALALLVSA